jgi:uncharacterized protein DUF932
MFGQLMLHRGGWTATRPDLDAVPVPEETESYVPVPYGRFVEEVVLHVPRFDLRIERTEYALARDGNQLFGVLTCTNGHLSTDVALAIGLRSSYDRSLALGLVAGSRVFACDNLAFSGEVAMHRKHTANVFRDLPDLIYRMLGKVKAMETRQAEEIGAMKGRELPAPEADHLILEALRAAVVPASNLPKVLDAWERPKHPEFAPRTAWSLYNAFTEVVKSRSPRAQIEDTLRLTCVFRRVLGFGNGNGGPGEPTHAEEGGAPWTATPVTR